MTDMPTFRFKIRRLGSDRTHYADVPDHLTRADVVHGRECRTVVPPVAALCGVVLGVRAVTAVVVMRDTVEVRCRACVTLDVRTPAVSHG